MKKLLCILILFNIQVHAKNKTFKANSNLADQLDINKASKWALDGGIFKDVSNGIYINASGLHQLILLDSQGETKILEVNIAEGANNVPVTSSTFYIDNKGPELEVSWKNIERQNNTIIVGPNSLLNWKSNDPSAIFYIYINDQLSEVNSPLHFNENISTVDIKIVDAFENESFNKIEFTKNFSKPDVVWKLASPSLFINNEWHSKKTAKIIITPEQGMSYKINGMPLMLNEKGIKIINGSELSVKDRLGNQFKHTINWIVDNDPPSIVIQTLGQERVNIKNLKVKINQDVIISARDESIGLADAFFYGKKRKWEPLPKTFVFLDSGHYRIRIKAKDKIGNTLKTKINIRVIKSTGALK